MSEVVTSSNAQPLVNVPTAATAAANRVRAGRADTLAALLSGKLDDAPASQSAPPAKAEPPPASTEAAQPEPETASEDVEADAPAETPSPAPGGDKPDAETVKRLAAVQAAEKRSREKLAAERAEFAAERAKLEELRKEIEAYRADSELFAKAKARAEIDPVSVLESLGVKDLEYAAKQAYAKAKADPANKEAAARSLRERELMEEIAELKKWRTETTRAEQERAQNEMARREAETYMADVTKAATAGELSPLAKHFMAKNPAATDHRLRRIAVELAQETGERPDVEDVLARYEKSRRAELEELGVDPNSILNASSPPKKNEQAAEKKNSAKTLSNDLSTPTVPRPRSSEREHRAETLALLESGRLEL